MSNKKPHIRKKGNSNNIAVQKAIINKHLNDRADIIRQDAINYSVNCMNLMSYMVLSDKFGFSNDDLIRYRKQIEEISDSLMKDYMSIEDIIITCKEEFGIELPVDRLLVIDPTFSAFINTENV